MAGFLSLLAPYRGWILGGAVAVALVVAGLFALDAYGDHRYDQGKEDNDRAWRAAEAKLHDQERDARTGADQAADAREADHATAVAVEKGKINDAIREGSSPFDVLFSRSGGVCVDKDSGCKPSGS